MGGPGQLAVSGCLCLSLTRFNFLRFSFTSSVRRQAGQVTGIPAGHRRLVHGVSRSSSEAERAPKWVSSTTPDLYFFFYFFFLPSSRVNISTDLLSYARPITHVPLHVHLTCFSPFPLFLLSLNCFHL